MEGNEFIIDRLPPGTNINHQAVFIDDNMHVDMRSTKSSFVLELSMEKFDVIKEKYAKTLGKTIQMKQNQMLRTDKRYPLDYCFATPIIDPNEPDWDPLRPLPTKYKTVEMETGRLARQNVLKNVVFNRLMEIRIMKKKPTLG